MSTILEIREELLRAEQEYKSANSMLDDNGNMLIAAKDKLKICRSEYSQACIDYCEEAMFCSKGD